MAESSGLHSDLPEGVVDMKKGSVGSDSEKAHPRRALTSPRRKRNVIADNGLVFVYDNKLYQLFGE